MTLDSVFGDAQSFQNAAKVESLQSELSAYKSKCTELDEKVKTLTIHLMNERNQHLKLVKELEEQIGTMKCFQCGHNALESGQHRTGRSTPTLAGLQKAQELHSEPLAQSTFDQSTLESFLDGEAPHRNAIQTIYRSNSKNLIVEDHDALSPVKWMDMEQKPFQLDVRAHEAMSLGSPSDFYLESYRPEQSHLNAVDDSVRQGPDFKSVVVGEERASRNILESEKGVDEDNVTFSVSNQSQLAGSPLVTRQALSSVSDFPETAIPTLPNAREEVCYLLPFHRLMLMSMI
jgi:hypothetical protein